MHSVKKTILNAIARSGMGALVRESRWRSRRLLILCWHGISLDDEHLWCPWLYTTTDQFRRRLETIRDNGYNVVPLHEGLERLWRGDLPPKSVALTFDDGFYDFFVGAVPALNEFGYPATVYLTTFYVDRQKPILRLMLSYLLWKSDPGRSDGGDVIGDCVTDATRKDLLRQLSRSDVSDAEKEDLICELACRAGIDYPEILKRRLLHLMNPAEVRSLASSGKISFELHTHRHRTPEDPVLLSRELAENQSRIAELTGRSPVHFCYPGGVVRPYMFPVLDRAGIRSAVTCEPYLAEASTNPYLVPRLLEMPMLSDLNFQTLLDGSLSIFQHRRASFVPTTLNVSPVPSAARAARERGPVVFQYQLGSR